MVEVLRPIEVGLDGCILVDDLGNHWLLKATFGLVGERAEIVGMEVRSVRKKGDRNLDGFLPTQTSGAGIPINSTVWRLAGAMAPEMRQYHANALAGLLNQPGNEAAAAAWQEPKVRVHARLKDVAVVYEAAVETGQSTTLAVSKHFNISKAAAAKRIQRARAKKLLPKAKPGRPARRQP